jgi:hypothetical protein
MKWMYVLGLLFFVPCVFAINLSSNETYVFNYTNELNVSSNETFFCAAQNASPVCAVSNVDVSLQPGESRTFTNSTCSVSAVCSSATSSVATCSISKRLEPGESYSNVGGSCNIQITVDDEEDPRRLNTTDVKQEVNITIKKKPGENGFVSVGDKSFTIPELEGGYYNEYTTSIMCPAEIDLTVPSDVNELLSVCNHFVPELVKHLKVTLNSCEESARTHVDDVKACGDKERELQTQLAETQVKLQATEGELASANNERQRANGQRDELQLEVDKMKIFSWFFGVSSLILGGVIFWLIKAGGDE